MVQNLPGGANGKVLQYSCLENPVERSVTGYSPWACKDSDPIEQLTELTLKMV